VLFPSPWILLHDATQLQRGTTRGWCWAQYCRKRVFQSPQRVPKDKSNCVGPSLPRKIGILGVLSRTGRFHKGMTSSNLQKRKDRNARVEIEPQTVGVLNTAQTSDCQSSPSKAF
jgi:hypothetical protein